MIKCWQALVILLITASCNVGTPYIPPSVEISDQWKSNYPSPSTCSCYKDFWWEVFDDPLLNELENRLLAQNFDLRSAYDRVQEARGLVDVARSEFYPQIYLNPAYNNEGLLYESYSTNTIVRSHQLVYLLPVTLSYEVDLWGKIRNRYMAAKENLEGEIDAFNSTMLILTADLAALYYQLRTMDAQIDLLTKTIDLREVELRINKEKYKWKVVNYYDVTRAELELSTVKAEYKDIERIRQELENRMAVLLGLPASEFVFEHDPLEGNPPEIPVAIPSEIIKRRPDIGEAERIAASEHSLTNAAFASFFPTLFLHGRAGSFSMHSRYFLKKKGRLWGFGADSAQMIFDGGKLVGELEIQKSLFQEASDDYKQRVLLAFAEVEDAMSNVEKIADEYRDISDAVFWATKTYNIANRRFRNGVTSFLDVVFSQQQQLANQMTQNNLLGQKFLSTIQLIKVIGGTWDCPTSLASQSDCLESF